jgi:hypothetical protein|tara:strand:+ start:716 stop:1039 length:324 start_codon:yes stop_codon:yes gene_type:complete
MANDVFHGGSYTRAKFGVVTSQPSFSVGVVNPGLAGATFSDTLPLQSGVRLKADLTGSTEMFVGSDAGVTTGNGYPLVGEVFIDVDDLSKVFVCASAAGSTLSYVAS